MVAADLAKFQANYPAVSNVVGGWNGQLSNSGETITLANSLDEVVDTVSYADEGDWAFREAGGGRDLVESITRDGSIATVRIVDHGYVNGDMIEISGADQPEYNGVFTVSGASTQHADHFYDYSIWFACQSGHRPDHQPAAFRPRPRRMELDTTGRRIGQFAGVGESGSLQRLWPELGVEHDVVRYAGGG